MHLIFYSSQSPNGFSLFPLLDTALSYAHFLASRFFHCLAWGRTTRVFSLLTFSTAWHGAGLRAFSHFLLFPLPSTALGYARFLTSRFFHCLAWGRTTRVFSLLAFSTAQYGAGLRAFSHFSLFPLPGMGPDYARFLTFSFFHCPAYKVLKQIHSTMYLIQSPNVFISPIRTFLCFSGHLVSI